MPVRRSRIFGDASWALTGQVVSGLVLLVGTRLITELVSPEIYGQVALFSGGVALGVSIFAYPFISAGMRLLPECQHGGQRKTLYRVVGHLVGRFTLIATLLLGIGGAAYVYRTGGDPWLFVVAMLLLAVTVRRELGFQLLIGERRQRDASLWQTVDSLLRPSLAILLVWMGGPAAVWVLLGYVLASVLANEVGRVLARGERGGDTAPAPASTRDLRKEVWAYALPLIPVDLLSWFNGLGDRYVIGYMMTAADVGIYAAAYTLVNEAFSRSAVVLFRTFQPAYFQHYSLGNGKRAFKIFWIWLACIFALGATGVLALMLLKDWVVALLLAESFHSAATLMPVIGLGCALQAVGTVASQPLLAAKRTRGVLAGRIAGALTAAISIPVMVHWQGLMGAAMAAPVYFGVEACCLTLLARPWRSLALCSGADLAMAAKAPACETAN